MMVFISSPGGLEAARAIVQDEIAASTDRLPSHVEPAVSVVRWPNDIAAGVADYGQLVINRQTLEHDILVCVIGTRMGSPTPRANSGTEEEFDRTIEAVRRGEHKQLLLFFSNIPVRPADIDPHQLLLVRAFREKATRLGVLFHVFDDYDDLRTLFRHSFQEAYAAAAAARGPSRFTPQLSAGASIDPSTTIELGDLTFWERETAPQRADVHLLSLAEYRRRPFSVAGTLRVLSPYFRFGFKFFDSREQLFSPGSVQTIGNNLVLHLGRNDEEQDWFYTVYRAGLRVGADHPIANSANWTEAQVRLDVAPAGNVNLQVNGRTLHELVFVMDGIPDLAILGWSDEHTFRCELRGATLTIGPGGSPSP